MLHVGLCIYSCVQVDKLLQRDRIITQKKHRVGDLLAGLLPAAPSIQDVDAFMEIKMREDKEDENAEVLPKGRSYDYQVYDV